MSWLSKLRASLARFKGKARKVAEDNGHSRSLVGGVQKIYRKLNPAPTPFFYEESRHDYLFRKIAKKSIQVIAGIA